MMKIMSALLTREMSFNIVAGMNSIKTVAHYTHMLKTCYLHESYHELIAYSIYNSLHI